jgi:hypothetical protein
MDERPSTELWTTGTRCYVGLAAPAAAHPAPSDERERFELWATVSNLDATEHPHHDYEDSQTRAAWAAWQAALSAQQAGGQEAPRDERAAFEAYYQSRALPLKYPHEYFALVEKVVDGGNIVHEYEHDWMQKHWEVWQARAALSASSAVTNEDAKERICHKLESPCGNDPWGWCQECPKRAALASQGVKGGK